MNQAPDGKAAATNCPFCWGDLREPMRSNFTTETSSVICIGCGEHSATREALSNLKRATRDPLTRAKIGYAVSRMAEGSKLTTEVVDNIIKTTELPRPMARIDELVAALASMGEPGWWVDMSPRLWTARLGCVNDDSALWVISQAQAMGLVSATTRPGACLTAQGWQHYDALVRAGRSSTHAFMAMSFGNEELWGLVHGPFKQAVAQTGFDLRLLAGAHQTAGSVDNRMRVEIRTSRFMVCDLSDGNQGAYWEAGFAEGLGRPVFYICRHDKLGKHVSEGGPHFDTAHQLIIKWDPADIPAFQAELKNAIRATLPGEAKMED